jgi:hypothetical protein
VGEDLRHLEELLAEITVEIKMPMVAAVVVVVVVVA